VVDKSSMVLPTGLSVIPMRTDGGEAIFPPRLQSYLFWRDVFARRIPEYTWLADDLKDNYKFPGTIHTFMQAQEDVYEDFHDFCMLCNNDPTRLPGAHFLSEDIYIYCLCELLRHMSQLEKNVRQFGSARDYNYKLDQLKPWGNEASIRAIASAIQRMKGWIEYPNKWVVISGPTGVGKTHIMQSIANAWYPFALYTVSSEMENWFRSGLSDNSLDKIIAVFRSHPILLIDDFGIEWATPWLISVLDEIIEWRSRAGRWHDLITVFATNKAGSEIGSYFMRDGVSRIGSRLNNSDMVNYLPIQTNDYRTRNRQW
jgi:DNA replication protein DnaC